MIALYGTDRTWRGALEQALRARGVQTRGASRPAELAKCLADGTVRLVVADAGAAAQLTLQGTIDESALLTTTPGETMESIVHRAMVLLNGNRS